MGVPQDHRFQYSNDLILDDFLGSHHFGNPDINMYIYIYICIYIYIANLYLPMPKNPSP